MSSTTSGEHACHKVLAKLDSYIDNELATETNLELMEHLEHCRSCSRETETRRGLRRRLQSAVRGAPVPETLAKTVLGCLRDARRSRPGYLSVMAMAATLAVCFNSWVYYQAQALRTTAAYHESAPILRDHPTKFAADILS